jgi:uncharacterized protein
MNKMEHSNKLTFMRINQRDMHGQKYGYWENYLFNRICSKGSFVNGKRNGLWKYYYYEGMINTEGVFKNDKPHGYWKQYNKNGTLKEIEFHAN